MQEWYIFTEDSDGNDKLLGTIKSKDINSAVTDYIKEHYNVSSLSQKELDKLEDSMWAQPLPY